MITGRSPYGGVLVVRTGDRHHHDALRGDVVPLPAHPRRPPTVRLLDLRVLTHRAGKDTRVRLTDTSDPWWNAVIYSLDVKRYADSDADGWGAPHDQQKEFSGAPGAPELASCFDFITMTNLWLALARGEAAPLAHAVETRPATAEREGQRKIRPPAYGSLRLRPVA